MPACTGGFPHSDAAASSPLVGSAAIFADWRVLRRLALPKHPSVALDSLARSFETAAVDKRPGPGRTHPRPPPPFAKGARSAPAALRNLSRLKASRLSGDMNAEFRASRPKMNCCFRLLRCVRTRPRRLGQAVRLRFDANAYRKIDSRLTVRADFPIGALGAARSGLRPQCLVDESPTSILVEISGVEPLTSCMPCKRSTN